MTVITQQVFVNNPNKWPPVIELGNGWIAHVHCEGARWHVLSWSTLGEHCTEKRCIINAPKVTQ